MDLLILTHCFLLLSEHIQLGTPGHLEKTEMLRDHTEMKKEDHWNRGYRYAGHQNERFLISPFIHIIIAPKKAYLFFNKKVLSFSYFFTKGLLMSTHNICFRREIRKIICGYPLLSGAKHQVTEMQYYHVEM